MKHGTSNFSLHMAVANVWVGSEVGYLKGVELQKSSFKNHGSPSAEDKSGEVSAMCWTDANEEQILLGLGNKIVKTFDVSKQEFVAERDCSGGEGSFKGLYTYDSSLVTCVESGLLRIWNDSHAPTDVKVGSHISKMRPNPGTLSQAGTGGKENDLKIWDLSRPGQAIFRAKNVRNDELDLKVPVWVTDMAFLPSSNTQPQVVVGTGHHQLRLYDTKAQRRPVQSIEFEETPITAMTVTRDDCVVIVGNTVGSMASVDLRKGLPVGHYKGFAGSIRCIECHSKQAVVASCGLDRFVRVHNINTRKLVQKVYLKSRLNCCLFSSQEISLKQAAVGSCGGQKATSAPDKSMKRTTSDAECSGDEDDLWNRMDTVETEKKNSPLKTKRKKRQKNSTPDDME